VDFVCLFDCKCGWLMSKPVSLLRVSIGVGYVHRTGELLYAMQILRETIA